MPATLTVLLLAATQASQPATRGWSWYDHAEADLLCTGVATENERRSLGAPTLPAPRDSATFVSYFRGPARDERHARFRQLAALASIGWVANRVNDQSVRMDAYVLVATLADRYAAAAPDDLTFRQIARCARAQLLGAALEMGRGDLVDMAATSLLEQYAGGLPTTSAADWPLLLAIREVKLEPKARDAIGRLGARGVELGGLAIRDAQSSRASRYLAAGASASLAFGDTAAARDLALRAMPRAGSGPPAPEDRWRGFPVLFDTQVRLTGLADAVKLAAMVEGTAPPATIDQRTAFEVLFRLGVAAEARGDFDAKARHQVAAFRALQNQRGTDTPSLSYYRSALDQLLGPADSTVAAVARNDPAQGAGFVATYLDLAETLIRNLQVQFVDDVRSRALTQYRIDNVLRAFAELERVRPADRARLADAAFRLAQARSFGRINLAAISAAARRADVAQVLRRDVDRFFTQMTQNGTWLRAFLLPIRTLPGQAPPEGPVLWRTMFGLTVMQTETSQELGNYLAAIRRAVPGISELLTPRPLPVAEFQRRLRVDEALVATAVTSREIHIWAITRAGVSHVRQPVSETELRDRVTRLRRSLKPTSGAGVTRVEPFDAAAAHDLYRWIFGPIGPQLRGVRSIAWYGNGPLGSVPPSVLVAEAPVRPIVASPAELGALAFLVDRYAFAVLPDLSLFPLARDRPPRPGQQATFLGIGAPLLAAEEIEGARRARAYDLAGGMDGKTLAELPKLEESVDEIRGLAGLFGEAGSKLWLGPAADERALATTDLTPFRTLAFATHGFLADEILNVREPSLLLALKPEATDRYDGVLTATEIADLKLDADLVILSACNTGSTDGRPGAETFTGLTQAFFTAGARSLMVSHWPVMSGAAVRLSVETVQGGVKGGGNLAMSLQAAIQGLRKEAGNALEAHPAYWGPFVIVGDGR